MPSRRGQALVRRLWVGKPRSTRSGLHQPYYWRLGQENTRRQPALHNSQTRAAKVAAQEEYSEAHRELKRCTRAIKRGHIHNLAKTSRRSCSTEKYETPVWHHQEVCGKIPADRQAASVESTPGHTHWDPLQPLWEDMRGRTTAWQLEEGPNIKSPKKGDLRDCEHYSGIMLLSVPGKGLHRILLERMKTAVESKLRDHQAGFSQNRSWLTTSPHYPSSSSNPWSGIPHSISASQTKRRRLRCRQGNPLETAWPLWYPQENPLSNRVQLSGNAMQSCAWMAVFRWFRYQDWRPSWAFDVALPLYACGRLDHEILKKVGMAYSRHCGLSLILTLPMTLHRCRT